jgi:pimeloyl-ACP methyl ester carboxylesterase
MMATEPQTIHVDVDGVRLGGLKWEGNDAAPTLVAVHGITANAWTWAPTARLLAGRMRVVAIDVRGRGRSADAPAPYGIVQHADDVASVIRSLNLGPVVLAGHSMGTYIAMMCAERHRDLVSRLILVDGAVALPLPEGLDAQTALDRTLGPSLARLRQSWPDPQTYREMWESHPAFAAGLTPEMEKYVMDDLVHSNHGWVSKINEEAVRTDGADLLLNETVRSSLDRQTHPITMVRAELGILAQPTPLIPAEQMARYPQHTWVTIPSSNHYDVLMGELGAQAVATAALGAPI